MYRSTIKWIQFSSKILSDTDALVLNPLMLKRNFGDNFKSWMGDQIHWIMQELMDSSRIGTNPSPMAYHHWVPLKAVKSGAQAGTSSKMATHLYSLICVSRDHFASFVSLECSSCAVLSLEDIGTSKGRLKTLMWWLEEPCFQTRPLDFHHWYH